MEVILNAFKDILKFKIVGSISTGDKTLDSLYVALALGISGYIFSFIKPDFEFTWVFMSIKYWRGYPDLDKFDYEDMLYISRYRPDTRHITTSYFNSSINQDNELYYFEQKLLKYIMSKIKLFNPYYSSGKKTGNWLSIERRHLLMMFTDTFLHPVFCTKDDILAINKDTTGIIKFSWKKPQTLHTFINYVNTNITLEEPDKQIERQGQVKTNYIFLEEDKRQSGCAPKMYTLYQNRNFDYIITKHKNYLITLLDVIKNETSPFNGFGSYNLGIILYGPPGTGKTSIIKAVANYLGRDIRLVNMRNVNTKSAFQFLFSEERIKNSVYVLEEFDFVQAFISRDDKEEKNDQEHTIKDLKEQLMKLMAIQANSVGKDSDNKLQQEIDAIKLSIKNLEDKLTVDTVLTVLDGVVEMRGRVIIATTNRLDKIEPALLREGRFDIKIHCDKFDSDETRELLLLMYKNDGERTRDIITTAKFRNGIFTPVQIIHICYKLQDINKVIDYLCNNNIAE